MTQQPDLATFAAALVDPRGEKLELTVEAPRPDGLAGQRLGLLDNTKWNARLLLEQIAANLVREVGLASTTTYRKPSWGQLASDELCNKIAAECDVVLTASGD